MLDLSRAVWRKASSSSHNGGCVEIAANLPGVIAVRTANGRRPVPMWSAGRRLPCSSPTRGRAGTTSEVPAGTEHDPIRLEESPGLPPGGFFSH